MVMLRKALTKGNCKISMLCLNKCLLTKKCVHWLSKCLCAEHSKLTGLSLLTYDIDGGGITTLLVDFLENEQCKLTKLVLCSCSLTSSLFTVPSTRSLCDVLCDEHSKLTKLSLHDNAIGDEDVHILCVDALRRVSKLIELGLCGCNLTDQCVARLCETLQGRNCRFA